MASSKRQIKRDKKMLWLCFIYDRKDVLFAKLNDKIDHKVKQNAWKEVHKEAIHLELCEKNKDVDYVRNTVWSNLKRRAVEKHDYKSTTGAGANKNMVMDEVDYKVMDIIGRDNPALVGLGLPEASGSNRVSATITSIGQQNSNIITSYGVNEGNHTMHERDNNTISNDSPTRSTYHTAVNRKLFASAMNKPLLTISEELQSPQTPKSPLTYRRQIEINKKHGSAKRGLQDAKRAKYEAQKDVLVDQRETVRLQNRKLQLEVFEMEKRLKVKPSESSEVVEVCIYFLFFKMQTNIYSIIFF